MEKLVLTVDEVGKALSIGRNSAYALLNRADFPSVHIGKRLVVPIDALRDWMKRGGTEPKEA